MKLFLIGIFLSLSTLRSEDLFRVESEVYEKTLKPHESDTFRVARFSLFDTATYNCLLVEGKNISAEGRFQLCDIDENFVAETEWANFEALAFNMKKGSNAGFGKPVIKQFGWDYANLWIVVTNHNNYKQRIKIKIYLMRRKLSYE